MKCLLLCIFTLATVSGEMVLNCGQVPKTALATGTRLRHDLFCAYDKLTRPVKNHTSTTEVEMSLLVQHIDYNDYYNQLEIRCLMFLHWHDQHLVWDESKYDSIDYMYVEGADLWHPDIVLFNTGNTNNQIKPFLSTCFVNSDGSVMCVSRNFFESRCRAELTYWPFDTRNCTLKFSSWASTGEQVNLTNKGGIWVEKRKNREWKYVSAKTTANVKKYECCPNDTFPDVTLTFQLERHSSRHVAIIIMPAVVLAMITLCSFWMPAVALERITMCCMTFVSHVFFLLYLGYMLPGNTNQVPHIVLYYRDSMILTTLAVLATDLGRYWTLKKSHPPALLSSAVNLLMRTGTGKLLLIRELGVKRPVRSIDADGEDCEGLIVGLPSLPSSRDSGWRLVVAFMDRAMFITYLALYLIFQTGLLP
uniref:Neurotransmitter-gated ion-channel ligand-binding domain-containing protein n=1 Tax=Timema monikensis TaxID=170555 RepID=A0A7R9EDH7_9NEOP|nr:unnamed protein product [Timema monikensis]